MAFSQLWASEAVALSDERGGAATSSSQLHTDLAGHSGAKVPKGTAHHRGAVDLGTLPLWQSQIAPATARTHPLLFSAVPEGDNHSAQPQHFGPTRVAGRLSTFPCQLHPATDEAREHARLSFASTDGDDSLCCCCAIGSLREADPREEHIVADAIECIARLLSVPDIARSFGFDGWVALLAQVGDFVAPILATAGDGSPSVAPPSAKLLSQLEHLVRAVTDAPVLDATDVAAQEADAEVHPLAVILVRNAIATIELPPTMGSLGQMAEAASAAAMITRLCLSLGLPPVEAAQPGGRLRRCLFAAFTASDDDTESPHSSLASELLTAMLTRLAAASGHASRSSLSLRATEQLLGAVQRVIDCSPLRRAVGSGGDARTDDPSCALLYEASAIGKMFGGAARLGKLEQRSIAMKRTSAPLIRPVSLNAADALSPAEAASIQLIAAALDNCTASLASAMAAACDAVASCLAALKAGDDGAISSFAADGFGLSDPDAAKRDLKRVLEALAFLVSLRDAETGEALVLLTVPGACDGHSSAVPFLVAAIGHLCASALETATPRSQHSRDAAPAATTPPLVTAAAAEIVRLSLDVAELTDLWGPLPDDGSHEDIQASAHHFHHQHHRHSHLAATVTVAVQTVAHGRLANALRRTLLAPGVLAAAPSTAEDLLRASALALAVGDDGGKGLEAMLRSAVACAALSCGTAASSADEGRVLTKAVAALCDIAVQSTARDRHDQRHVLRVCRAAVDITAHGLAFAFDCGGGLTTPLGVLRHWISLLDACVKTPRFAEVLATCKQAELVRFATKIMHAIGSAMHSAHLSSATGADRDELEGLLAVALDALLALAIVVSCAGHPVRRDDASKPTVDAERLVDRFVRATLLPWYTEQRAAIGNVALHESALRCVCFDLRRTTSRRSLSEASIAAESGPCIGVLASDLLRTMHAFPRGSPARSYAAAVVVGCLSTGAREGVARAADAAAGACGAGIPLPHLAAHLQSVRAGDAAPPLLSFVRGGVDEVLNAIASLNGGVDLDVPTVDADVSAAARLLGECVAVASLANGQEGTPFADIATCLASPVGHAMFHGTPFAATVRTTVEVAALAAATASPGEAAKMLRWLRCDERSGRISAEALPTATSPPPDSLHGWHLGLSARTVAWLSHVKGWSSAASNAAFGKCVRRLATAGSQHSGDPAVVHNSTDHMDTWSVNDSDDATDGDDDDNDTNGPASFGGGDDTSTVTGSHRPAVAAALAAGHRLAAPEYDGHLEPDVQLQVGTPLDNPAAHGGPRTPRIAAWALERLEAAVVAWRADMLGEESASRRHRFDASVPTVCRCSATKDGTAAVNAAASLLSTLSDDTQVRPRTIAELVGAVFATDDARTKATAAAAACPGCLVALLRQCAASSSTARGDAVKAVLGHFRQWGHAVTASVHDEGCALSSLSAASQCALVVSAAVWANQPGETIHGRCIKASSALPQHLISDFGRMYSASDALVGFAKRVKAYDEDDDDAGPLHVLAAQCAGAIAILSYQLRAVATHRSDEASYAGRRGATISGVKRPASAAQRPTNDAIAELNAAIGAAQCGVCLGGSRQAAAQALARIADAVFVAAARSAVLFMNNVAADEASAALEALTDIAHVTADPVVQDSAFEAAEALCTAMARSAVDGAEGATAMGHLRWQAWRLVDARARLRVADRLIGQGGSAPEPSAPSATTPVQGKSVQPRSGRVFRAAADASWASFCLAEADVV